MQISLDFQSKAPIYTQIVEQVKGLVAAGVLAPGDQLPTVREVAADLRINFNTVARAYRLLHDEGIISTQQGRGTYVLAQAPPADAVRLRHAHLLEMVAGWLAEAERLGFRADEVARAWAEQFAEWARREM
ncbi:MAG: GntR family transcriptional regulator [Chloroflexi bacterium]|nr:GntR family transcriptional regulator [Chloroflexota bacterium]